MPGEGMNLLVRNHTDCIILMNAVREHCQSVVDGYQFHISQLLAKGDREQADRVIGWRDSVSSCQWRTMKRLEMIRKQFENEMDYEEPGAGSGGTHSDESRESRTGP